MVCADLLAGGCLRPHRPEARRSRRHRAAELRGRRHAALGLSARGHRDHAGQLARQGGRTRLLHRKFRSPRRRVPGCLRAGGRKIDSARRLCRAFTSAATMPPAHSTSTAWSPSRAPDATPRVSAEAWSIMLYTSGTTSRPKGVPRRHRAERAAGIAACRAKSLPARRTHARRDAALSHHGRALADRDVADRRHLRLPAALRRQPGAGADRGGEDHQSLSGADALPRSGPCARNLRRPTSRACESSALPARR